MDFPHCEIFWFGVTRDETNNTQSQLAPSSVEKNGIEILTFHLHKSNILVAFHPQKGTDGADIFSEH